MSVKSQIGGGADVLHGKDAVASDADNRRVLGSDTDTLAKVVNVLRSLSSDADDSYKRTYYGNLADSMVDEVRSIRKSFGPSNGIYWEWKPQEDIVDWNDRDFHVGDSVLVMYDPNDTGKNGDSEKEDTGKNGDSEKTDNEKPEGDEYRNGPSMFRYQDARLFVSGVGKDANDEDVVRIIVKYAGLKPSETITVRRELVVHCHNGADSSYPVLRETGEVRGKGSDSRPWNAVINGDNLYALQALFYPYRGKVDYIYIDPPYNTKDKSWVYNNDYVSGVDSYKSSMWLTFMERRLRLAKFLLNPNDSVLCLAIDDTECWTVGNLLKDVFPSATIQMVTLVTNSSGGSNKVLFAKNNEYLFFVRLSGVDATGNAIPTVARTSYSYWNRGGIMASRREKKYGKSLKEATPGQVV